MAPVYNDIPKPRLSFFGVIDERLDAEIITRLADKRPGWQIILVGPVIKIDPSILPRRPNIHYFGQQPYADLPRFLAGWDVCLLPFACNAATRFISSTKTLEYMAAEKSIVSTPITDVAEPYGAIIYLADSATAFIAACEEALSATPEELASRHKQMRHLVGSTSWETTAAQMRTLIEAASAEGLNPSARALCERLPHEAKVQRPDARYDSIIIGAGPTGLSAAYHLGKNTLLIDRDATVGGWCRSIEDHGFTFDYAGHIMFSNDPYVHRGCTRYCSVTACTGRIARPGSTARAYIPATRSGRAVWPAAQGAQGMPRRRH